MIRDDINSSDLINAGVLHGAFMFIRPLLISDQIDLYRKLDGTCTFSGGASPGPNDRRKYYGFEDGAIIRDDSDLLTNLDLPGVSLFFQSTSVCRCIGSTRPWIEVEGDDGSITMTQKPDVPGFTLCMKYDPHLYKDLDLMEIVKQRAALGIPTYIYFSSDEYINENNMELYKMPGAKAMNNYYDTSIVQPPIAYPTNEG